VSAFIMPRAPPTAEPAACVVAAVAGLHSSNAIVLAAWGWLGPAVPQREDLPTPLIPGLMERLGKALRRENDRLFMLPGPALLP
jgi:hypothetical protein